ncbi:uncharacterized protein gprin1 [Polymixia lowei]
MGSLKDEMRGPRDDRRQCEMTDDGDYPSRSNASRAPEGLQINTSQLSTSQEDNQPNVHMNTNYAEEKEDPTPKDPAISVRVCGNTDDPDSIHAKDYTQTDVVPKTQQPDAEPVNPSGIKHEDTTSTKSTPNTFPSDPAPTHNGNAIAGGQSMDKDMDESIETKAERGRVRLPASPAQDPCVPCSPAPAGQQHIHTQVSLEVVQSHSVATSPMTPPEGDQAFFFPYYSGKSAAVVLQTKDVELQVGQQVEFRSVATAPMTPKTPVATTFPELSGRGAGQDEKMTKSEAQGQTDHAQQESCLVTKSPADAKSGPETELIPAVKITQPKELTEETGFSSNASPESSVDCPPIQSIDSQVALEDSEQQCEQQAPRMGSRDQDITILVTHHDSTEAEDEEAGMETESSILPTGPEVVKTAEYDEHNVRNSEAEEKAIKVKREEGNEGAVKQTSAGNGDEGNEVVCGRIHDIPSLTFSEHPKTDKDHFAENKRSQNSGVNETKEGAGFIEDRKEVSQPECSLTKPPAPSSPAPSGCHHIHTQVSLEVVQCHSVATSPMTPPDGVQTFFFPNSCGRSEATEAETRDAELQVGKQVEFRSVATAPMTPKTPTAPTGIPDVRAEERIEEKILEEEEDKDKKETTNKRATEDKEEVSIEDEDVKTDEEKKVDSAAEEEEEQMCKEESEEKSEEPVQEVSWDEKGMTWEVYGAVVEVAVLGSAIQKHLEKQVKKYRKQPSLPPPPPLSPSAIPLPSASPATAGSGQGGSGKGRAGKRAERDRIGRRRRNPFRLLLQNMQQPPCCSRAHVSE